MPCFVAETTTTSPTISPLGSVVRECPGATIPSGRLGIMCASQRTAACQYSVVLPDIATVCMTSVWQKLVSMKPDNAPQFDATTPPTQTGDGASPTVHGEQRLLIALTVLALMALPFLEHDRLSLGPKWLILVLGAALLSAIVFADPIAISRRSRILRLIAIGLVALFIIKASWSTVVLLIDLVQGAPEVNNATLLLITGALVWFGNNTVFALLYWELDSGGPAARALHRSRYPDLAFPGHLNPDVVPPNWRPLFVDYLYLGLTNALAFSPTDVMPLTSWAKLTMALQSLISVAILSLVIARAINILT